MTIMTPRICFRIAQNREVEIIKKIDIINKITKKVGSGVMSTEVHCAVLL